MFPVAITGVLFYAKVTGDSKITHVNECLFMTCIFIGMYAVALMIASMFQRAMYAGASIKKIDKMSGEDFEKWLYILYKRRKYRVSLTPPSSDYGADLIVTGKNGTRTAVQAKRYRNAVGEAAVQQVIAAREYYDCDEAMVVTNSYYTKQAIELAERADVLLIDRRTLATGKMYP